MLANRPEFNIADTGAMHLGATAFSVYNTSTPEQVEFLFGNAANRVVITERAVPARGAARRSSSSPALEHIVLIDGDDERSDLARRSWRRWATSSFDFEAAWRAVEPDDVLTLIYTSGTTGPPKGVQLTHRNLMAEIRAVVDRLPTKPGGRIISFLPSAHIADRWASHYQSLMVLGFTLTCLADPRTIVQHLPEVRPTAWGSVPRIWEKMKAALEAQGVTDPAALPEEHKAAIREKLGLDRSRGSSSARRRRRSRCSSTSTRSGCRSASCGGCPRRPRARPSTRRAASRSARAGPPLQGVELKLADDGELLVRGEIVMTGYRNDPEKTARGARPRRLAAHR